MARRAERETTLTIGYVRWFGPNLESTGQSGLHLTLEAAMAFLWSRFRSRGAGTAWYQCRMGAGAIALIVVASLAFIVGFVVLMSLIMRRVRAASRRLIEQSYAPDAIVLADDMANSFGIESKGAVQLRGNGGLVLTRDLFHFMPLAGGNEVKVPLGEVTNVEIVSSHLGKTVGRPLVKVHYKQSGANDAVALFVADPSAWKQKIEELRGSFR